MDNPKTQLIERLQAANNILVTVSTSPSVDQLSAAIGLTLALNKLGKHGTAVFSGKVPSTLEFLQPEETLEGNTDSLRDFIIALDKTKADKLRYKVEDKHVKIFITPYRTSITNADLEFSQGDFNVDVVVALGVHEQNDLDGAITVHGRILHDATVSAITTDTPSGLGSINLVDTTASSLCEIVTGIVEQLKKDVLDAQMATALLTGIVAETERFSNAKTSSATMTTSARLMSAGANQQLVATKLQEKVKVDEPRFDPLAMTELAADDVPAAEELPDVDGSLQIEHPVDELPPEPEMPEEVISDVSEKAAEPPRDEHEIHVDEHGEVNDGPHPEEDKPEPSRLILQPPERSGTVTASSDFNSLDPANDPLGASEPTGPILSHKERVLDATPDTETNDDATPKVPQLPELPIETPGEVPELPPPAAEPAPEEPDQTLADIEQSVASPHISLGSAAPVLNDALTPDVSQARDAVMDAINAPAIGDQPLEPIQSLNAQPVNLNLHDDTPPEPTLQPKDLHIDETGTTGTEFRLPTELIEDPNLPTVTNPTAPPPVPPPMMPPLPGMGPMEELPAPGASVASKSPANPGNPFNLPPA